MRIVFACVLFLVGCSTLSADPLTCGTTAYKAVPGLTAIAANNALTVTWDGENSRCDLTPASRKRNSCSAKCS